MTIAQLPVGMLHTNCYILKDDQTGDIAVIDPGAQTEKIMQQVELAGGKVKLILLTHGHFDHILAAACLKKATGAKLILPESDWRFLAPD